MSHTLSPTQQKAYDALTANLPLASVHLLWGGTGKGRTTLLRKLYEETPGAMLLTATDLTEALERQHDPMAIEEALYKLLHNSMSASDVVIIDDFSLIYDVVCGCRGLDMYPRKKLMHAPLTALAAQAEAAGKTLVFACNGNAPDPLNERGLSASIEKFTAADYASLCAVFLGSDSKAAANLDYNKIFRFAPKLNAHQLKAACVSAPRESTLTTDSFIEYLRSRRMTSNVELAEVQAVELSALKGVDDIIEALEASIVMPLENDALSAELGIKPKRGVLLAGPPGTGKTTVGRALAHRLRSKFFLIDGTFISGTQEFYGRIRQIFEAAKQNAPSIIFIDDSDVIFENGEEAGLYRYLLTMLDGLESESTGRVCVMLTAMNVANLPPALLRSGRIELWLETRLPDETARMAILSQHFASLPPAIGPIDLSMIVAGTDGLTGADLKRVVEDGKILFAYDRSRNRSLPDATEYFLRAVETVRSNKERYAKAEASARIQRSARPPWFDMMASAAAMEDDS